MINNTSIKYVELLHDEAKIREVKVSVFNNKIYIPW